MEGNRRDREWADETGGGLERQEVDRRGRR
jgi:hypothetical protein